MVLLAGGTSLDPPDVPFGSFPSIDSFELGPISNDSDSLPTALPLGSPSDLEGPPAFDGQSISGLPFDTDAGSGLPLATIPSDAGYTSTLTSAGYSTVLSDSVGLGDKKQDLSGGTLECVALPARHIFLWKTCSG